MVHLKKDDKIAREQSYRNTQTHKFPAKLEFAMDRVYPVMLKLLDL